jgi:hypothetical protein
MVAAIAPLCAIAVVVVAHFWVPEAWTSRWEWYHYAIVLTAGAGPIYLLLRFVENLLKLGVRGRMRDWLTQTARSPAEHAAAAFYLESRESRRIARAAIVTRYLDAVPPEQGRLIVVGDIQLQPYDDGTLNEEADALEGRARKVPRWIFGLLAFVFVLQLFAAVMTGGVNPLHWKGTSWTFMAPATINAVIVLMGWGVIRPPGSVAIVSPRSVTRNAVRGELKFTTDDSILMVSKVNRMVICAFYRRDGRCSGLTYPSADTKGLAALVNRWCLLPAAVPTLSEQPPQMDSAFAPAT